MYIFLMCSSCECKNIIIMFKEICWKLCNLENYFYNMIFIDYVKLHIDIIHISSIKKTRFYKIQGKYIKNSTLKGNSQIRWVLTKQNIIQYKIGLVLVRSTFYWWRKPGDLEKTTDLSQVTDKLCCTPRPDRDSNSHTVWFNFQTYIYTLFIF
jgi:hypothetical protein